MTELSGNTNDDIGTSGKATDQETEGKAKPNHVNEFKTGQRDPFTAAFNAAQDELAGDDEESPKAKSKPKKAAKEPEPKEKPKAEAKQAGEEAEEGEDGQDEEAKASEAERKTKPLEPKKWWSARRKDAFKYQRRDVQESWLQEEPQPDQRWTTEQKEAFQALPVQARELVLERQQEIERGFGEKFEALAEERKLADGIKSAVPAELRQMMQQRGIGEVDLFGRLVAHQLHSIKDPLGFVRSFIVRNRIDPRQLFVTGENGQLQFNGQGSGQAGIASHPDYIALKTQFETLRRSVQQNQQRQQEIEDQQFAREFDSIMAATDTEGNPRFPYIRVVANEMAQILEDEADRFDALSTQERFEAAYNQALENFPELPAIPTTAAKVEADEPETDDADLEDESERAARIKKAASPKSRTPQTAPKSDGVTSLDDALAWASKKIGKR